MSTDRRPSSIDGIKRFAKAISKKSGIAHVKSLDEAAKLAGFQNFAHARRIYSEVDELGASLSAGQRRRIEFHYEARANWIAACKEINTDGTASLSWRGAPAIMDVLAPFMGENANHVLLPSGGGRDFHSAMASTERGCIDFAVGDSSSYVAKPKRLHFERIEEDEAQSFFLLELDNLARSGVYEEPEEDDDDSDTRIIRRFEEVLELTPGEYVERSVWDAGHLGYDENDYEIALPASARLIVRWLRGKMLIVCKRSIWNLDSSTYDGRHNERTARQIRAVIERSIAEHAVT